MVKFISFVEGNKVFAQVRIWFVGKRNLHNLRLGTEGFHTNLGGIYSVYDKRRLFHRLTVEDVY